MPNGIHIHFERDAVNDIHIAYPVCHIATEDDSRAWMASYRAYFEPIGRKVDLIAVLDMFSIEPAMSAVWGAHRLEMLKRYTRYSARVSSDATVAAAMLVGSVELGALAELSGDIPAAIAYILRCRGQHAGG